MSQFDYKGLNEILNGNVTSTKVVCKDGTIKYQQSSPNARYGDACADNGGRAENKFDNSGINEMLKNSIPFIPPFMQPIIKNGSDFNKQKGEIERQQNLALEQAKLDAEKAMSDAQKNKTKEPIYYILVTAGVIIAGYFAYKKFKK
jgi:hypothetical protein